MARCGECVFAGEPSPTIVMCRLKHIYRYIDDPACEQFQPYSDEEAGKEGLMEGSEETVQKE